MGICRAFESSFVDDPACDEILTMDLNEITEFLQSAARSVGAEVTSPWFYLQLGLILVGAGIALGAGAAIRARIDITSVAMGWPAPLRLFMRVLVGSAPTAVFALLMTLARVIMVHSTWPSRRYLLSVAASLAAQAAWLVAALSILGLLVAASEALDSVSVVLDGRRLRLVLLIKLGVM